MKLPMILEYIMIGIISFGMCILGGTIAWIIFG